MTSLNSLSTPYFKQPNGSLMTFDFAVAKPTGNVAAALKNRFLALRI